MPSRSVCAAALLFVTLARPELLDTRVGWGSGLAGYTTLTLGPLAEDDSRALVARRLADERLAEEVLAIAEGNPLFIEQLAASLGEVAIGGATDEHPRDRGGAAGRTAERGTRAAPRRGGRRQESSGSRRCAR